MKRFIGLLIISLCLNSLISCISFKVKALLPGDNQIDEIHLCKKIDDSGELLKPLEIQTDFSQTDISINCYVRLKDVSTKIYIQWKWYSPDKKIFRETGEVMVNENEKYLETVTAYDKLYIEFEDELAGEWTVIFLINNRFAGKRNFRVISSR